MLFRSVVAALAAILVVAIAVGLFSRHGKGKVDDDPDGATASHAGAMLSALFLLVFAIAIIVPWTNVDSARENTYAEAQGLTEAYWSAGSLPPADATMIRTGLRDYTGFVQTKEWPLMAKGRLSDTGWSKLDTLRAAISNLQFKSTNDQATQSDVLDQIRNVYAARQQRAVDAKSSLPTAILIFTVLTGLIMIIFPLLAGARPRGMALLPLLVMAGMLGISIYLVFDINHTFAGDLSVKPDAFKSATQEFQRTP
jgi:Protein of unknown function (DUF4239)